MSQNNQYTHVLMSTSKGDIKIALDAQNAPITVQNFLQYVESGFFKGTIFHRVIKGFMIQGGGLDAKMDDKDDKNPSIKNEANNGLKNKKGSIAMARTNEPHSASSQFFINVNDNAFLDFKSETPQGWGYAVFGEVVEGMDVVTSIEAVRTGSKGYHQDVPLETIEILDVKVV
jgi:peptidyl-prolyl cis-trans isomerase B (cyclophilin B)